MVYVLIYLTSLDAKLDLALPIINNMRIIPGYKMVVDVVTTFHSPLYWNVMQIVINLESIYFQKAKIGEPLEMNYYIG